MTDLTTAAMGARQARQQEPQRGTHDFADQHQILPSRSQNLSMWGLLGIVAVGDAANFYVALATLSGENLWIVAILTFALTAAAVALMHSAGHSARELRAGHASHGWRRVHTAIGAWLLLGLGAFYLRLLEAFEEASGNPDAFGGTQASVPLWETFAFAIAVLMLLVYLAGGVIAYVVGYKTFNPARAAYFRARAQIRSATRRQRILQYRIARLDRKIKAKVPISDEIHAAQIAALDVVADALRHHHQLAAPMRRGAGGDALPRNVKRRTYNQDRRELAAIEEAIANKEIEQKALANVLQASKIQAQAKSDELRQHVRLRMAAAHGDPATTSALHTDNATSTATTRVTTQTR